VGGEERVIHVNSSGNKKFNVKLPDFEVVYLKPYELTATGNIKIDKISTVEAIEINKKLPDEIKELIRKTPAKKDIWQYGADGNILNGTMTFRYSEQSWGEQLWVSFTFPFCPGAAYAWLSKLPDPTVPAVPGSPPGEPGGQNPPPSGDDGKARYFAVPALLLLLALAYFLRRPVCVSLEVIPGGVRVFRDWRGPVKVKVSIVGGIQELAQRELEREESFVLPVPAGAGTVRVKVPVRYRNVSKKEAVIT
jgi:hypothetical protein